MNVIDAQGLHKRYGDTHALAGFDLQVAPGRIVGLIGPNGSGKTTAIKALLGLTRPDAGSLSVLGVNPQQQRAELMARTAYIADTGILPGWMKVADLIDFVAGVHTGFDRPLAERTLASTDIRLNKKVKTLSKGMHVQLHLALILAIHAELLILDEPTLGLDILYRQRFYDALLNDYMDGERSIVVTTHEVREIEHILTDVVFIHHGRQILSLDMDTIGEEFSKVLVQPDQAESARALTPLSERPSLKGIEYIFRHAALKDLQHLGEISRPNLAELFVALLGDEA
jgi:ABC-2 type transport system ATP-binding protein